MKRFTTVSSCAKMNKNRSLKGEQKLTYQATFHVRPDIVGSYYKYEILSGIM